MWAHRHNCHTRSQSAPTSYKLQAIRVGTLTGLKSIFGFMVKTSCYCKGGPPKNLTPKLLDGLRIWVACDLWGWGHMLSEKDEDKKSLKIQFHMPSKNFTTQIGHVTPPNTHGHCRPSNFTGHLKIERWHVARLSKYLFDLMGHLKMLNCKVSPPTGHLISQTVSQFRLTGLLTTQGVV